MTGHWSDRVDEILDGDHALMLAYATPANGVVLLPVTNFAVRNRDAGTVTSVNTSVGAWKKLERIRDNPRVALAFHTREHATTEAQDYVLVQGTASLGDPVEDYPSTILENWERYEPWRDLHPLWKRWRRVYGLRVPIEVAVERVLVWPDLGCHGPVEVQGTPLPEDRPAPQAAPRKGTAPRIDHVRAAAKAARLPHVLLGWIGADGFPMVVPAGIAGSEARGIVLESADGIVPEGGRRAGLTAHWFSRSVTGQNQRKHTGWLDAGERVVYAPHTQSNYRFPASRTLFQLVSGGFTRLGVRGARRAGFLADGVSGAGDGDPPRSPLIGP